MTSCCQFISRGGVTWIILEYDICCTGFPVYIVNCVLLSSLEIVLSTVLILFPGSSSRVNCIEGVKLINTFRTSCIFIYYIPTNCTNLLFMYKQHIKTFVLFKLLKLIHVSVTDWPSSGTYNIYINFSY
jgi:hypothetical protein